ncbi:hypothetical protein BDR03DRAFT_857355 [Suillus americanus]|nr:hypothetical protein BDR03DRAFT_857355 [Suillus americanus]
MLVVALFCILFSDFFFGFKQVTNPVQSTVCNGGQSCDVEWVDDGQSPLLSDIGECTVGLYNGEMALVQSLTSVNVANEHSFSFTVRVFHFIIIASLITEHTCTA